MEAVAEVIIINGSRKVVSIKFGSVSNMEFKMNINILLCNVKKCILKIWREKYSVFIVYISGHNLARLVKYAIDSG